jgi:hypothetical protein
MKKITLIIALLSGSWCFGQTQNPVTKDSLPIKVKEKLEQKYNGYSISNIIKETGPENAPTYKVQASKVKVGNGKSTVTVYNLTFNTEGKLLSQNKRKEIFYTESPTSKQPSSHSKGDGHNNLLFTIHY